MILVVKRFRLKAGVDEATFLEVDGRLQREFTYQQPGLAQCTTAKATDGGWLVLHLWTSNEAADAPSGRGSDIVDAWADLIDLPSATIERFAALS